MKQTHLARSARRAAATVCMVIASLCALAASQTAGADAYDAALHSPKRPAQDASRDAADHPAALLRLAGIAPGMHVADFLAADGYYTELLSTLVGPGGHVLMINNLPYDKFSDGDWQKRIAGSRLPNVEHRTVEPAHMGLEPGSLDAILLVKVFHDLYWVDPTPGNWPKIDVRPVLDQLAAALKPGGVLLLVDHSAKAGAGSRDASSLHRIDEAFTRKEFESRGLKLVRTSDILRKPDDARNQVSYKPPMLGKTDRFVLLFKK